MAGKGVSDDYIREDLVTRRRAERAADLRELWITVILIAVCLAVVWCKTVWLEPVSVSGRSMEQTLKSGDLLVIDKIAKPERGDVVVFDRGDSSYIKRVIALGGDSVLISDGKVFLKRKGETQYLPLSEDYAYGVTNVFDGERYVNGREEFIVEDGKFFALGDNRGNSTDCRVWKSQPIGSIRGVVPEFIIKYKDTFLGRLYKFL